MQCSDEPAVLQWRGDILADVGERPAIIPLVLCLQYKCFILCLLCDTCELCKNK